MNHIINFRGTNGSGKTTLAKALMRKLTFMKDYTTSNGVLMCIYVNDLTGNPVAFVGKYEGAVTGGVDRVKAVRDVIVAVAEVSQHADVVMEGLILSGLQTLTKEIADASAEYAQLHAIHLSTPLEVCIANTFSRRAKAGNTKPFDPEKSLVPKYRAVELSHVKLVSWGMDSIVCSQREAHELACEYLHLEYSPDEELVA